MSFSEIKYIIEQGERSQSLAREFLSRCPDIMPEEVRKCLAHLLDANSCLASALKLLMKEVNPDAKLLTDVVSSVAQELAVVSERWRAKQSETQEFLHLLVDLSHEGDISLTDLRDIAREAGVLSEGETKMQALLDDLRQVGALADARPKGKRLYRLGEALIV